MQESWLLPVLGVVIGTIWWAIDSLLVHLVMRVLGARATWRLAARVTGYGAAWTGPALLAQAPAALFDGSEMEWWLLYLSLSIVVVNGGAAYGRYAFARGRAMFSLQRAAAAALLATVPGAGLQILVLLGASP